MSLQRTALSFEYFVHDCAISGPIVADNFFTLSIALDATFKGRGRVTMEEIGG